MAEEISYLKKKREGRAILSAACFDLYMLAEALVNAGNKELAKKLEIIGDDVDKGKGMMIEAQNELFDEMTGASDGLLAAMSHAVLGVAGIVFGKHDQDGGKNDQV